MQIKQMAARCALVASLAGVGGMAMAPGLVAQATSTAGMPSSCFYKCNIWGPVRAPIPTLIGR